MSAFPSRGLQLSVALALLVAMATAPVSATEDVTGREPRTPPRPQVDAFVPGQLVVRFEPGTTAAGRAAALAAQRATLRRELRLPGLALVQLPPNADVAAAAAALERRPGVAYAEPNFIYRPATTPNDPRYGELWGLNNGSDHDIDAPEAWNITTGRSRVVVAVVDSGVDWRHPDLAENIWRNRGETADGADNDGNGLVDDIRGWDFVANDKNPRDENGHGTHVAGTIGARGNNGAGIAGVNWKVKLMALRAGDANGNLTNADIVDSFDYACDEGADVVNGSFGGGSSSQSIQNAINGCPDVLFVFAAGNGGTDGVGDDNDTGAVYPCSYGSANIVCVAATGPNDQLTTFSNYGATAVDLAAPGLRILSATHHRVLFRDGFESGLSRWVANKTSGKTWSATTEASASGSYSATDSAGTDYSNSSNTWIETAGPTSLSGGSDCALDYTFALQTESKKDFLYVEGSTNGGSSWTVIDGGLDGDQAWTGSSGGAFFDWTENIAADGFGGNASLDLRFRLISDVSGAFDGAHVDDVALRCVTGTHGSNDFVELSGTSMATPHVAGVAALVLAEHPNLSVALLRAALLDGVDPVASLSGKVASGGRLNARGALDAVEDVAPVAFKPNQRLIKNSTLGTSQVPVKVSWIPAADAEPSSGIHRYHLQQRTKSGSTWGPWTNVTKNTTQLTRTAEVDPGKHQFRVRAQDGAGNWSAWKAGDPFVLKDPQSGTLITLGGSWSTQASSSFYDGSTRRSSTIGSSAEHSFSAKQVAWVSTRGPDRGRAKVFIDGALVQTIDLHTSSFQYRRVVYLKTFPSVGPHSIQIKVIDKNPSSSGRRVDLDAYVTMK